MKGACMLLRWSAVALAAANLRQGCLFHVVCCARADLGEDPPYNAGSFAAVVTRDAQPAGGSAAACAPNVRVSRPVSSIKAIFISMFLHWLLLLHGYGAPQQRSGIWCVWPCCNEEKKKKKKTLPFKVQVKLQCTVHTRRQLQQTRMEHLPPRPPNPKTLAGSLADDV